MSTVIGIILCVGCLFLIGYFGYGIYTDIKDRKKKNNEKGGKP